MQNYFKNRKSILKLLFIRLTQRFDKKRIKGLSLEKYVNRVLSNTILVLHYTYVSRISVHGLRGVCEALRAELQKTFTSKMF